MMHFKLKLAVITLSSLIIYSFLYADSCLEEETPEPVGNLSLPISQIPGCLFGFGQHVVEKGDLLIEAFTTQLKGRKKSTLVVDPYILYGIRNDLSFLINLPVVVSDKYNDFHSSGFSDIFPILEYAFYQKSSKTAYKQATVVAGATLATGSHANAIPHTGFGSPTFFLGFTGNYIDKTFYYFASVGTIQTTTNNNNVKFGSSYIYQFGGCINLGDWRPGWIFALGCEFNGIFTERDKISGVKNPNTGGNVIFFGPSFFASTEKLIFQIGLQGVISEHLFGVQNPNTYLFAMNVGWKFN